jgi:hypothetical protein
MEFAIPARPEHLVNEAQCRQKKHKARDQSGNLYQLFHSSRQFRNF